MPEFQLGFQKYCEEHKGDITPQLSSAGMESFFGGSQSSLSSLASNTDDSVSSSSLMPPPPPPSTPFVDDLAGRKTVVLRDVAKKVSKGPMVRFHMSETLSVESKKVLRVSNDPCGGSFNVINFKRVGKEGKEATGTGTGKTYEFSFVENYGGDLYEACIYFMQTKETPELVLPEENKLAKKEDGSYDMSLIGKPVYSDIEYKVADLSIFMKYQFGSWYMMVRKYKTKVTSKQGIKQHKLEIKSLLYC